MSIEPSRLKYMVSSPGGVTIRGLYGTGKDGVKGAIMSAYTRLISRANSYEPIGYAIFRRCFIPFAYKFIYHSVTSHFNIKM